MGASLKLRPPILYSVLFHGALLVLWAFIANGTRIHSSPPPQYILVEVEPPSKSKAALSRKNQVVQTNKSIKTSSTTDDALLGEQTQKVERQMISTPKTGAEALVTKAAPEKKTQTETTKTTAPKTTPVITAMGALAKFGISISAAKDSPEHAKPNPTPIEQGSLTAQVHGEYVKGFKVGEETMLNTREFVFYGYFQRIRQRLDRAWDNSLRDRLAKYFYRGRQLASETDYMTQLLVSLDKEGKITKVQIIGASGTTELDEAATKAFNDAGPFPNPPTGLVDTGGQVLVRWDFVLKT